MPMKIPKTKPPIYLIIINTDVIVKLNYDQEFKISYINFGKVKCSRIFFFENMGK